MCYRVVYKQIMQQFGWQQVALLAEDGHGFPEFHTFLEDYFLQHGINVVYHRKMPRHSTTEEAMKVKIDFTRNIKPRFPVLLALEKKKPSGKCAKWDPTYHLTDTAASGLI